MWLRRLTRLWIRIERPIHHVWKRIAARLNREWCKLKQSGDARFDPRRWHWPAAVV
jgi:hypothetical protein